MTSLLLTRDPDLREATDRIAAGAGVALTAHEDVGVALAAWSSAAVVLVGDDVLDDLVAIGAPRREEVHVVSFAPDREVFQAAVTVGVRSVLCLPDESPSLLTVLADADEVPGSGRAIGVVGGSGGVGASTFACALGQVAGRTSPSLVVDLDPMGPGVDRLLGLEGRDVLTWESLASTHGRLGARALRESVPRRDGVGALSWGENPMPVATAAARDVVAAARRGHELVALDLSRSAPELSAYAALCDVVVVLASASVPGAASAARLIGSCPDTSRMVLGVRRGGPHSVLEDVTGLRIVVELPEDRRLDESVNLGLGPVRPGRSRMASALRDFLGAVA